MPLSKAHTLTGAEIKCWHLRDAHLTDYNTLTHIFHSHSHKQMNVSHIIILALLIMCPALSSGQGTFTIMSYNIENAFDTIHDEGKNDYEFLTGGVRHWSTYRLFKKLRSVGKVIAAANEQKPTDLIALCEVENENVMDCLTKKTPLTNMGYRYVMTSSQDERGIDVALLYSPFTFHLISHSSIYVSTEKKKTRDILHVTGTILSGDTIDAYVVHMPSKLGGKESEELSIHATGILIQHIDSVSAKRTHPNVILMGDFNADDDAKQIKMLTRKGLLTNITRRLTPGTYYFQGKWSCIDHILTRTTSITHMRSRVLALPFLLEEDELRRTKKPYRTFLGPAYHGGVSDHLPLVSTFSLP